MRKLEDHELQSHLLIILKELDRFCREQKITYYLSGGTLLGAVRHQGFIPWDDDIDIMMPRPDYDRFLSSYVGDRFQIAHCEQPDTTYGSPYARMWDTNTCRDWGGLQYEDVGLFIDIMPIDGYPPGLILSKLREAHVTLLRRLRFFAMRDAVPPGAKFPRLKAFFRKHFAKTAREYSEKINRIGRKYDFAASRYVGVQSGTYHAFRERNPRSLFSETVFLPFEGLQMPAPTGYDVYLRHLFGDYMQLPPPEQRVRRHAQTVYVRDETLDY